MGFGLFKKDRTADTVFTNGNIYTQNRELPWAEAVACRDGKFIYVGNSQEVERYIGPDTYTVDLSGKYVLPGLINTHNHAALRIFEGMYIPVSQTEDLEGVLGVMSDYIFDNPEQEAYFGYGFEEDIVKEMTQKEASEKLDAVSTEKPILLLNSGEDVLWVNNCALEQARAAAQQDGILKMSVSYFMQAVAPFNEEDLQNRVKELASEYSSKGFTSIFNVGAPEFMNNVYQEILLTMYQQETMKQRYFGSLELAGNKVGRLQEAMKKLIQKRTHTTELDDFIHCNILKLTLGQEDVCEEPIAERLQTLLMEASERGFDVHVDALDHEAFIASMEYITAIRNAGYRKNNFIIACDKEFRKKSEGFNLNDMSMENVFFQPSTRWEPANEYAAVEEAKSIEEVLDCFTVDAAESLGIENKLGSIEIGKLADFAVFEKNPFGLVNPMLFKRLLADMTVIAGQVVYDAEEENMQEWYNLMSGIQL
ncbi:amidohydrolase family protein [Aminipila luticellarii]|nr:amidohydrolase family protein [Aminipila luticellarii]